MIPTETRPYEAAAYLNTVEECALYLQTAIEEAEGDSGMIAAALDDISKAKCMTQSARDNLGKDDSHDPAGSAEEGNQSTTEPADHKQFPDDRITEILQRTWGAWGQSSRSEIDRILANMRDEW